uniref:NADH-ubiquinone oxidoreductase chain 3 n=1 Tax=Bostrichoidea sp. 5 KM-2017 TaxID=2219279 RepID=A0A346RGQ8_9COLE|nr:NADH dehydrogenase subunit 3 [Bostrichoidea sp. 5 KM-2017]
MITLMLSMMILMISVALIMINSLISKKTWIDYEKSSPFECGFDPKSSARKPFSIQFFLITIIFLVFDVEITIILPMIKIMNQMKITEISFMLNLFILILIVGIYHEWNQGALNWQL